jgi:DNA-directed RNA polymerase subunit RPC12/RpoP
LLIDFAFVLSGRGNEMLEQSRYLCKVCRNIFIATIGGSLSTKKGERCPHCGSPQVMEAPAWAPLGSGFNIFEGSTWKYECHQCGHTFEMPIPKSPTEDKDRKCPVCGQGHLHLLTEIGALPLYCG